MSKLVAILLLFPCWLNSQISFIKTFPTGAQFDLVAMAQLNNGNYVCSALLGLNNVWYNRIYLFDECSELITQSLFSTPAEYMFINQFTDMDSTSFLASGYVYDSVYQSIHLILENNTLQIKKQKRHNETNLYEYKSTLQEGDIFYQVGFRGYSVMSSRINTSLQRNYNVYRVFMDNNYPDLWTLGWLGFRDEHLFTKESYRFIQNEDENYHIIRCMDRKLNDQFVISSKNDSSNIDYRKILMLGQDTLLAAINEHLLVPSVWRDAVIKYYRDSILFYRVVDRDSSIGRYSACFPDGNILHCINYDGATAEFSLNGEMLSSEDHLVGTIGESDLSRIIRTRDGGYFALRYSYNSQQGHVIKMIKLTPDYQILPEPDPACIVGTENMPARTSYHIYPNPTSQIMHLDAQEEIEWYKILSLDGKEILAGKPGSQKVDIHFQFLPGTYLVQMMTQGVLITEKFIVVE